MNTEEERPRFVGGPEDGKFLEERFPAEHPLHGLLPSAVMIPDLESSKSLHRYDFLGGTYVYTGTRER